VHLTEHTLARTGSIDSNDIEPVLKLTDMRWLIAGHHDITNAPTLHIIGKGQGSATANIVCHNQS
jgi:hypothetical protein